MRWDFIDENSVESLKAKDDVIFAIDRWWEAFQEKGDIIVKSFSVDMSGFDLVSWMQSELSKVCPNRVLFWEFGPAVSKQGHRLVLIIREVLQAGNITRRSWLLFFDEFWKDEWLGIWDDSPPPPSGQG